MSATYEPLAIAAIDRSVEHLNTADVLLKREFEVLPDGDLPMTELWDGQHPACRDAVANMVIRTLRTDVSVVGRRVEMTADAWRGWYGAKALN